MATTGYYHIMIFIKQHDAKQCGIACLAMICAHYKKKYSLEFLSLLCPATHEGISLLGLSKTAERLGFESIAAKVSIDQLDGLESPCILHWNQNHYVVLYKTKNRRRFYVADPGKGLVVYSIEEFKKHWVCSGKGIVLYLRPTRNFGCLKEEKTSKNRSSTKIIFGYLRQYRGKFSLVFIGLLIGCVLQLVMPFLTQSIVDIGIRDKDINFIWLVLIGELIIVIGSFSADFIRRWLLLQISMRVNISFVSDFFIKLLRLPMSYFDTKLMGDLLQRISDHNRVQTFLTTHTLGLVLSVLSFVVFGVVLLFYDSIIFIAFMIGSIAYGLWILVFLKKRKIIDYELFEKQAINKNKTYQFLTSIQEIKLQDCECRRCNEWKEVQTNLYSVYIKSQKLQQTQEAGSVLINEIKNIIITALAANAVINGQITLGTMLAIQYIIGQLNSPVEHLMNFIYSSQDMKISIERINEVHNAKDEVCENNGITEFKCVDTSIVIDKVDFKYDRNSIFKTLDGVTFIIPKGKVTAIVGPSGSGKTTLIKLLLGYYYATYGNILIGGTNISEYNIRWWRRQCGAVMQDSCIFSESIARNIAVNDGKIDYEQLEYAARLACIHDFIMELPLKYDTQIGNDGMKLSQGQMQRILIARTIYRNPSFIFLDEATNSLDAENERIIVNNLSKFYQGKTVVIVAHRLSTVKNADQIVVLNHGQIIEKGNHMQLVSAKGFYYNLVKNQLELGN